MTTPERGLLFHFTHIDNLESIAEKGLHCDDRMSASVKPFVEVGNRDIKDRRRNREVLISPGGAVSDYVPFYFAARSPMLYAIHMGNVESYSGGEDEVVYLVTDTEAVSSAGLPFVFTDRNAALRFAKYSNDLGLLDTLVDWPLMEGRWFDNTDNEPDRLERRMAELLVHQHVPWSAFTGVAARTNSRAEQAEAILSNIGLETIVQTRPNWYFS